MPVIARKCQKFQSQDNIVDSSQKSYGSFIFQLILKIQVHYKPLTIPILKTTNSGNIILGDSRIISTYLINQQIKTHHLLSRIK